MSVGALLSGWQCTPAMLLLSADGSSFGELPASRRDGRNDNAHDGFCLMAGNGRAVPFDSASGLEYSSRASCSSGGIDNARPADVVCVAAVRSVGLIGLTAPVAAAELAQGTG